MYHTPHSPSVRSCFARFKFVVDHDYEGIPVELLSVLCCVSCLSVNSFCYAQVLRGRKLLSPFFKIVRFLENVILRRKIVALLLLVEIEVLNIIGKQTFGYTDMTLCSNILYFVRRFGINAVSYLLHVFHNRTMFGQTWRRCNTALAPEDSNLDLCSFSSYTQS